MKFAILALSLAAAGSAAPAVESTATQCVPGNHVFDYCTYHVDCNTRVRGTDDIYKKPFTNQTFSDCANGCGAVQGFGLECGAFTYDPRAKKCRYFATSNSTYKAAGYISGTLVGCNGAE